MLLLELFMILVLALRISEMPKWVLWQTVKTKMNYNIMHQGLHCFDFAKTISIFTERDTMIFFEDITCDP